MLLCGTCAETEPLDMPCCLGCLLLLRMLIHRVYVVPHNGAVAKPVVRCRQPSVLTYSTKFMQERIDFLTATGMPLEDIAKAAVSHPQVSPFTMYHLCPHGLITLG